MKYNEVCQSTHTCSIYVASKMLDYSHVGLAIGSRFKSVQLYASVIPFFLSFEAEGAAFCRNFCTHLFNIILIIKYQVVAWLFQQI